MSELPRGLRNRNPGNIRRSAVRYKGETESDDAAFKAFASTAWGYRAMFVLLHTYRVRHRIATLRGMIARWAPPSENDTGTYLRTVVRRSGVDPDAAFEIIKVGKMWVKRKMRKNATITLYFNML